MNSNLFPLPLCIFLHKRNRWHEINSHGISLGSQLNLTLDQITTSIGLISKLFLEAATYEGLINRNASPWKITNKNNVTITVKIPETNLSCLEVKNVQNDLDFLF